MNIFTSTRAFGALIMMAVALFLAGREFYHAEWLGRFRRVMAEIPVSEAKRGNLWTRYLARIRSYREILDKPYEGKRVTLQVGSLCLILVVITRVLHYNLLIGLILSTATSLLVVERIGARKARRRREEITAAWLYEAVPVAVHVLTATGRLDAAIVRMSQRVQNQPLKNRLIELSETVNAPQFSTPADAFAHWASGLQIRDIDYFAMATTEARKYGVPLAELWLDMADLLGKDLEYMRTIRAQTSHHRTGGYVFYGMLAIPLLIAYPFGERYMSPTTKVMFWVVFCIMTLGLYLIHRESQRIDA